MAIVVEIGKKQLYLFAGLLTLITSGIFAVAFGGSNPAIVGHSALELIVNGSSVVDNSLSGADIDEATLGGVGPIIAITAGTEQTIQAAIDNLATRGGGIVLMAAGTYTVAGPINMSSNISLVGQGTGTILQATTNGIDVITEQSGTLLENVRLKDFAIRPGSATGIDGVIFTSVSGLIEGLDIVGVQSNAISVGNPAGTTARGMVIRRNKIIMAAGANGISITGGNNIRDDSGIVAEANIIDGNMTNGIQCNHGQVTDNEVVGGIGILAGRNCIIQGNIVSSTSGAAISVTAGPSDISNNIIEQADDEGILFNGAGATISENAIRLYSVGGGTHAGIRATASSGPGVTITGNHVDSSTFGGGEGINVTGEGVVTGNYVLPLASFYGIAFTSGGTGAITGNVIDTSGTIGGIFAGTTTEMTISGNTFINTGNADINITSATGFAVTGNYIRGDLDATGSGTCALTGNVVTGTLFAGACSASNNV